jgi:ADP-heptose:LPS heptosyltransferase
VAVSRPRLLAYRALGLGDLLCGVPALRALRAAFPEHEIALATPRALAPLAELSGAADAVVDSAPLAVPDVSAPDLAVNLHGRGPESHRALLATAPGRLIAFACEAAGMAVSGPTWRAGEHEVTRWCRLLAESGIPADPGRLDLPTPPWPVPDGVARASVVHPGAASPARRWPASRWAAVAAAERGAGRAVVVTGSAAERPLAEEVARTAGLPADAVLAGRTDLRDLAAIVAAAGRLFSGDTGIAHLATAFGTPSVVLFGPTPPAEWGPPSDKPQHVALHHGGRGDPHGDEPDPGLLSITVDEVLAAARRPISGPGAPAVAPPVAA